MVDISSGDKKINITVSTSGNKASVNATPDTAMYYSNKSREWAISDKIVSNEDYSSKYYAQKSKEQAQISTNKTTEVVNSGNEALSNIDTAKTGALTDIETNKTNAITDITNQENISVDNVNTAGVTQVNLAKEQANIATTQAGIATAKTSEVVESGNAAITAITEQETTSKNNIEAKGAEQIGLIQNEGATQIANVQSTGFYMRDDKLYYINSQGEETEFKSGGSGLEVCDIGMALYVDETKGLRRYLNGQIVDINTNTQVFLNRLQQITTLHPSLLCTEEEWQSAKTMSAFGQVGKFVFNYSGDDIVSVRIPRVVNVQGLFDLQNLGMTVSESLPNIKQYLGRVEYSTSSPTQATIESKAENATFDEVSYASDTLAYITFNANNTNSVYQDNAHVQQEAIQYPYFIQIATGSETENNIINDIELNNPYSLFECKYADHELFNLSWLVSNGSYNGSNAVHPSAYQALLVENNAEVAIGSTVTLPSGINYTKQGISVKLSTETYTDYDFVINSANETFRPPIKPNNLNNTRYLIETGEQEGISYRIYADGYCEQWGYIPTQTRNDNLQVTLLKEFVDTNYNLITNKWIVTNVTNAVAAYSLYTKNKTTNGFTTSIDPNITCSWEASGYLADGEYTPLTDNILLYYYVGETVQNANLIDAGRIGEQLANKQDKCIHIIDTYINGTSGYRIWSDGYCEQWGQTGQLPTTSTITTISLLKAYNNTNYFVQFQDRGTVQDQYAGGVSINNANFTTHSFQILPYTNNNMNIYWKASGYLAQGEY